MVPLHPHGIPRALLRRLCDVDDDLHDLGVLLRGRTSKGILRLRAIRDLAVGGSVSDTATTTLLGHVEALAALQHTDPAAVTDVLTGPHFGAWAVHCTRRLSAPRPSDDVVPLAVDLGYLGCFVGAAAIRAGTDVTVSVPIRDGAVVIPATGRILMPRIPTGGWATLRCDPHTVRVETADFTASVPRGRQHRPSPGWRPIAAVHGDLASGRRWSVAVDPQDPYLRFFGSIRRDSDETVDIARWSRRFGSACAVVDRLYSRKSAAMARSISCLVPVAADGPQIGLSATSASAAGAVALTEPSSALGLAVTLVHEHQHLKLNALHDLLPLVEPGEDRYYSPWRDDPRPAVGLLHGAYAFLGVGDFWFRMCRDPSTSGRGPELEFARVVRQLDLASATLNDCPELTVAGTELVTHLVQRCQQWQTHTPPPDVIRIAGDLVREHRVRWRLRHLAPRIGATADEPSSPGYGTESGLAAAAKQWAAGEQPAALVDRLILDGRYAEAQSHLDERLRVRAAEDDWAALVVVAAHTDLGRRCPPLCTHPDLAYALYRELRSVEGPLAVTALADALTAAWRHYVAGTSMSLSVRM